VLPTMVDFPTVVQEALAVFGEVFDPEAARRHCAEYLTGLRGAANKPVSGRNRACALTTDPAGLHRWLTEVPWDVTALQERRLAWRPQAPQTRYRVCGVSAIAKTLGTPAGKLLEDVGWVWAQADERPGSAPDDGIANDACPSGAHDPLEWRRCKKRETWAAKACKDPTPLGSEWLDAALTRGSPGDWTCDSSCPRATVLQQLQRKPAA
jgi:hypothetical protein